MPSTNGNIDQELEIQALKDEKDQLLEIVSTLRGQQNASTTNTFKHERAMKVLESIETMSNKGNLDIDIATLLKTIIAD